MRQNFVGINFPVVLPLCRI